MILFALCIIGFGVLVGGMSVGILAGKPPVSRACGNRSNCYCKNRGQCSKHKQEQEQEQEQEHVKPSVEINQ